MIKNSLSSRFCGLILLAFGSTSLYGMQANDATLPNLPHQGPNLINGMAARTYINRKIQALPRVPKLSEDATLLPTLRQLAQRTVGTEIVAPRLSRANYRTVELIDSRSHQSLGTRQEPIQKQVRCRLATSNSIVVFLPCSQQFGWFRNFWSAREVGDGPCGYHAERNTFLFSTITGNLNALLNALNNTDSAQSRMDWSYRILRTAQRPTAWVNTDDLHRMFHRGGRNAHSAQDFELFSGTRVGRSIIQCHQRNVTFSHRSSNEPAAHSQYKSWVDGTGNFSRGRGLFGSFRKKFLLTGGRRAVFLTWIDMSEVFGPNRGHYISVMVEYSVQLRKLVFFIADSWEDPRKIMNDIKARRIRTLCSSFERKVGIVSEAARPAVIRPTARTEYQDAILEAALKRSRRTADARRQTRRATPIRLTITINRRKPTPTQIETQYNLDISGSAAQVRQINKDRIKRAIESVLFQRRVTALNLTRVIGAFQRVLSRTDIASLDFKTLKQSFERNLGLSVSRY